MAGYVGDVAIAYDRDLGHVLFEHYAIDIARRATERSVHSVLEIAAGTGIVTRQLRNVLPKDALLSAIDISDSMMDVARAKFLPHEQVTFQIADATALPFDDEAFDVVVCQFGVMFFDKEAAFREAYRTLKCGGRYLFSVWDSRRYNPFASLTFEVLKQFFPSNPPRFLEDPVSSFEIDPVKETLICSGFERMIISVQKREYDILDVPAFARGLVFSPVIEEIRERGGVEPEKIVEALAEALTREYGSNPTRYPMQAILFEAEKP
ncbi:class I SAM-dependent methyltransferase [Nitrosospira multiformis]|uniref:Ubiquinone/menaquinone biosynthesis C-methylase UbiE n=1 Tax=Nitrosospira multiformis TaxID=1231 RepID=A0A1I7FUX2_9PROT|nr:class I SAM-dependent methyltransferase [Nitrosospira multiformis]SFU39995.1 Ubiquinone/menaquinone biosynthesis C-methylase UbiE [Nitrosospira multiformis]